jgi:hypothetical protein
VMYREQFNGFTVPNGQGKRKKVKVLSIEYWVLRFEPGIRKQEPRKKLCGDAVMQWCGYTVWRKNERTKKQRNETLSVRVSRLRRDVSRTV